MNGQTKEESKYIDKQRDDNCLKYLGEETIRIIDEGDIRENILNSKLNKIFDLSKIDWNKCEEFALKNLIKEVCNYWIKKETWETVRHLSSVFNLNKMTIRRYLKIGTSLGWCDYDCNSEKIKDISKKSITVEVFKDSVSVGVFSSAMELSRQSYKLFGVKLLNGNISSVARGATPQYKGFTFKYINSSPSDLSEEKNKRSKNLNNGGKPVEIFKDGVGLGIFPSCSELSRQSKERFGVKLDQTLISRVAIGKRPRHHGFTFRYITETTTQEPNPKQSA